MTVPGCENSKSLSEISYSALQGSGEKGKICPPTGRVHKNISIKLLIMQRIFDLNNSIINL
jgi:hypothetical protein